MSANLTHIHAVRTCTDQQSKDSEAGLVSQS